MASFIIRFSYKNIAWIIHREQNTYVLKRLIDSDITIGLFESANVAFVFSGDEWAMKNELEQICKSDF